MIDLGATLTIPEPVDPDRNERAARALASEVTSAAVGFTVIHVLLVLGAWGNAALLHRVVWVMMIITAVNIWLSRVAPRHMTLERLEGIRLVVNIAYAAYLGTVTDWALPVWFLLPFGAVVAPALDEHRGIRVGLNAAVMSALALLAHVPLAYPAGFSALALACYTVTTAKTRTISQMLGDSDRQRREMERAHAELARANDRIRDDMAVLRKTEMELRQAQKLEAVGRLASGIAHEINTPIQFVGDSVQFLGSGVVDLIGAVERHRVLLAQAPPGTVSAAVLEASARIDADADIAYLGENLPAAAERARDGLERVATIVRSMKEFAHPDRSTKSLTDLNRAIQATLVIARNEYKYIADVRTEFEELPPVLCFAGELNQVVLNLVVNAAHSIADAAPAGEKGTIVVRTRLDARAVVIEVSDTGTGIPERVRERIFEPFFTTKDVGKGTGQGLALARAVVERHSGTISFETEVGRGTTFVIRIPISDEAAPAAKEST